MLPSRVVKAPTHRGLGGSPHLHLLLWLQLAMWPLPLTPWKQLPPRSPGLVDKPNPMHTSRPSSSLVSAPTFHISWHTEIKGQGCSRLEVTCPGAVGALVPPPRSEGTNMSPIRAHQHPSHWGHWWKALLCSIPGAPLHLLLAMLLPGMVVALLLLAFLHGGRAVS